MFFKNSRTLSINRPFPSITSFTVTNDPPLTRWRLIIFYSTLFMRFILTMTSVCLIQLKFRPRQASLYDPLIPTLFYPALNQLSTFTGWLSTQSIIGLVLVMMGLSLFGLCDYKEEKLIVIASTGVMVSTANTGWWGISEHSKRLVMLPEMEDILIHEGYVGSKAKLAISLRGEDELLVVFPTLPPDRKILELVGRETSKLLKRPYPPLIMSDSEDYGRDPRAPASPG